MSTLTKVFIVLNFLFAVTMLCVQAVLFAQKEDWKGKWVEEVNNHTKTLMIKDSEIQYWIRENSSKDKFISQLKTRINDLEKEKEDLVQNHRDLNERFTNLQGTMSELSSNYDKMTREVETIAEERSNLRKSLAKLGDDFQRLRNDKDTVTQDYLNLQAKLDSITKNLSSTELRLADVIKEKKQFQSLIDELQRRGINVEIIPSKRISGKVTGYDEATKITAINVGKEHGVKIGMEFAVYRNTNFVASGVVVDIQKDYSFVRIELTKLTPAVGDSVSNNFSPAGTFSR